MDRYVCVEELQFSAGLLKRYTAQLEEEKQEYDKKGTVAKLQDTVKSLWDELEKILMYLSEYGDKDLLATAKKLYLAFRQYDYLHQDYTGLCKALLAFAEMLPANKTANMQQLARLANRADFGFYPTDPEHVRMIKRAIRFPDAEINLLDPCCGEGTALAELAEGTGAVTYGAELAENRADAANERLSEVAYGSFFRCNISPAGAFHGILLNPPYVSMLDDYGFRQRMEKTFLAASLPHLARGGLLIYIIPYYRAAKDICNILCSSLDNIRVYRFLDAEFKKFRQVVFMGTKAADKEEATVLQEADSLFQLMLRPGHIPLITELPEKCYSLPEQPLTVKQFRGCVVNQAEINKLLKSSDSAARLFDSQDLETRQQQPLLPLGVGHIGLIGGSGLMNGLVECETPHVIKGKVVKTSKTEIIESKKETTVRTVTSNKMIFHVLTPDGLKTLA